MKSSSIVMQNATYNEVLTNSLGCLRFFKREFFKEDADGSRADETAILHNPIRKMEPLEN